MLSQWESDDFSFASIHHVRFSSLLFDDTCHRSMLTNDDCDRPVSNNNDDDDDDKAATAEGECISSKRILFDERLRSAAECVQRTSRSMMRNVHMQVQGVVCITIKMDRAMHVNGRDDSHRHREKSSFVFGK